MKAIGQLATFILKLFTLGLLVRVILSWVSSGRTRKAEEWLDKIYEPVLRPMRQVIRPVILKTSPPRSLDLAPVVLIILIWWLIEPFFRWLFS